MCIMVGVCRSAIVFLVEVGVLDCSGCHYRVDAFSADNEV